MIVQNNDQFNAAVRERVPAITLVGNEFRLLEYAERPSLPIVVYAHAAKVYGLSITGSNLRFIGGEVQALNGDSGNGPDHYGFRMFNAAAAIYVGFAKVRNADRGFVFDRASEIEITGCDVSVRQDGIIANASGDLLIMHNEFHDFQERPGDHSDAIQLRNGIKRCRIIGNHIRGVQQGIGQMDAPTDRPLSDVEVRSNYVGVTGFHSITFGKCDPLTVIGNTVEALTPGRKTTYRLPPNAMQENNRIVQPWR